MISDHVAWPAAVLPTSGWWQAGGFSTACSAGVSWAGVLDDAGGLLWYIVSSSTRIRRLFASTSAACSVRQLGRSHSCLGESFFGRRLLARVGGNLISSILLGGKDVMWDEDSASEELGRVGLLPDHGASSLGKGKGPFWPQDRRRCGVILRVLSSHLRDSSRHPAESVC